MSVLDDMTHEELCESLQARESEIEQLKGTILKQNEQLAAAAELVQQLTEDADRAAKKVGFIFARLAGARCSCDTAALIATHRDELDGALIDRILARAKGGQVWREDVLAVLNDAKRQGGQAKEG